MGRYSRLLLTALLISLPIMFSLSGTSAWAASAESYFNRVKNNPLLLRNFLYQFPKGGELHSHLDGAIYAESYIAWAAIDGKCINLSSFTIVLPPCDASEGHLDVADIQAPEVINSIIDAFSMRNSDRGPLSDHDQFFITFQRYFTASLGRQGSMLAEVTARAARQNVLYLEIMQSFGMDRARKLAVESDRFNGSTSLNDLVALEEVEALVTDTIALTDHAEQQWHDELGCKKNPDGPGCTVEVRYLAQVIRTFPGEQVLAQTLLAFKLIEQDPRYVGLNFVAPEDAPITLRDYTAQMQTIRDVAAQFPGIRGKISLHAGELALPLVAPEELRRHIREAVHIAGASRIGHGVDVIYEDDAMGLLAFMAKQQILVEINLTSNAVLLGVEGDEHPFELYRSSGVPLALSTDDEGVIRIDLTHEYVRATQTYHLSYAYLKELSRNALAYSFLPGDDFFIDIPQGKKVKACAQDKVGREPSNTCQVFLAGSEKARLQWQLEEHFNVFEARYD